MNCPNCGEEITKDSTFCRYCGTKIKSENKNSIFLRIKQTVLIIVFLFFVFFFFIDNPKVHPGQPTANYMGEKNGQLLFDITSTKAYHIKYAYDVGDIDFFTHIDNRYYGHVPVYFERDTRHRKTINIKKEAYEEKVDISGDNNVYYADTKPFNKGVTYIAKIKGRHKGIIFKRKAKDIICLFTIEQ